MSTGRKLDKDWIDLNYSYLRSRLGMFPIFEPAAGFYDDLARLGELDTSVVVAGGPLRKLFSHISLPELHVSFESGMKDAGEFQFTVHPNNPALIQPVRIHIAEKYRLIKDLRERGMVIGAILAHEIAHYYIMKNQIRRDTTDNERLTDLGLVILGFGKLWFNGRNRIVDEHSEQLGYLKPLDMTYAYMEYGRQNSIPVDRLKTNLTPEALQIFSFWLGMVTDEVKYCQRREALDNAVEARRVLAEQKAALEDNVQKVTMKMRSLQLSLTAAAETQEIINKTHQFWEILPDDHRIMAAFVIAHDSGAHEAEIAGISWSLVTLGQEVHQLSGDLQPAATKDPALLRQTLDDHQKKLSAITGRVTTLQQQIAAVASVHERCFKQIDAVHRDVQENRAVIGECLQSLKDVCTFHTFLSKNPATWRAYSEDPHIQSAILQLTGSDAEVAPLALADYEMQGVSSLISLPIQLYAERLSTLPPLKEIAGRVLSERDHIASTRQAIEDVLASQVHTLDTYIEDARRLEMQLQEILATGSGIETDIRSLKSRQDRMYAHHDQLSIKADDEEEFALITRAILSCSPEGEFAFSIRRLTEISTLVRRDMERVKGLKECSQLLPMETHRQAFDEAQNLLRQVSSRVCHWKLVQQAYIDRLDRMEQQSMGNILRRAGEGIQGVVKVFIPGKKT